MASTVTLPKNPSSGIGGDINLSSSSLTVGDIVNSALKYVYVVAGLILLFMLVSGGITLMTSGGDPDKTKAGYSKITKALIGFLIIFVSYFVAQLLEVILGVKFL